MSGVWGCVFTDVSVEPVVSWPDDGALRLDTKASRVTLLQLVILSLLLMVRMFEAMSLTSEPPLLLLQSSPVRSDDDPG